MFCHQCGKRMELEIDEPMGQVFFCHDCSIWKEKDFRGRREADGHDFNNQAPDVHGQ